MKRLRAPAGVTVLRGASGATYAVDADGYAVCPVAEVHSGLFAQGWVYAEETSAPVAARAPSAEEFPADAHDE